VGSLRRFNINELRTSGGISALVETGTYLGEGIDWALSCGLDQVHSIEIDSEYYFKAIDKYRSHPQVSIHLGSSSELLPDLLKFSSPHCNTLFWLDAHFPMADKGSVPYNYEQDKVKRMPIIAELSSIVSSRAQFNDIIIIDDLRCFVDDPRIKADSFDVHMSKLGTRGQNCTRQSVVGITLDDILCLATANYDHHFIFEDEGYVILTRKSAQ
jgi:hypothetical protein